MLSTLSKTVLLSNGFLKPCVALMMCVIITFVNAFSLNAQEVAGIVYSDWSDVDNTFDMVGQDVFGQRFPSEYLTIKDEVTGVDIVVLTTSRHSNSKMYQIHPQWTPDGEYIMFRSSRAGGQYYAVSMENYEIVQITTGDNKSEIHMGWEEKKGYQFRMNKFITTVRKKSLKK